MSVFKTVTFLVQVDAVAFHDSYERSAYKILVPPTYKYKEWQRQQNKMTNIVTHQVILRLVMYSCIIHATSGRHATGLFSNSAASSWTTTASIVVTVQNNFISKTLIHICITNLICARSECMLDNFLTLRLSLKDLYHIAYFLLTMLPTIVVCNV